MGPCSDCQRRGQVYGCATGCDALADPAAALPGTGLEPNTLDVASSYVALQHRFTQFIDELRGLVLNDCLRVETIKLDANGQGEMRIHVPCAAIAAWNHGANTMTVTSSPQQASAPTAGIGVQVIAGGGWAAWPATGTFCSVYGTAGDFVTIALYEKQIPPGGSGGGGSSSGPSVIVGDTIANPGAAIPESAAFGMVWDEVNNVWVRARGRVVGAGGGGAVPAVALQEVITFANLISNASGNMNMARAADIDTGVPSLTVAQSVGAYLKNPIGGAGYDLPQSIGNGDGVGTAKAMQPSSTPTTATAAANTAVTTTYGAVASQRHRLQLLIVSWSGAAPAAGTTLIVQDGAGTVFTVDVPAALGPFQVQLPPGGIQGSVNTAMTITVAAGGGAAVAKLNTAKLTG